MNIHDLKPAHTLAKRYGVKVTLFGDAGSGKTPCAATAPRPVILATESGMGSMRGSNVPAWEAFTAAAVADFMKWFLKSNETKNFDTLIIDSFSHLAEIILKEKEKTIKHGMQAYGAMNDQVLEYANDIFYLPQKHVILIAKQCLVENGKQKAIEGGEVIVEPIMQKRPYFPGKELNTKLPHLFDSTWHLSKAFIQGHGEQTVVRTIATPEIFARDRAGNLAELEPPNFTYLFNKSMGN
jgi:hypothetical protein